MVRALGRDHSSSHYGCHDYWIDRFCLLHSNETDLVVGYWCSTFVRRVASNLFLHHLPVQATLQRPLLPNRHPHLDLYRFRHKIDHEEARAG